MTLPHTAGELEAVALRLRKSVVRMAAGRGEGYVGQGLQAADLLAVLFAAEMNWRPDPGEDPDVDRFVLSTGHYSIALWAAFAEVGALDGADLDSYGEDGSRIIMSTERGGGVDGVELTGGSLGHGLGVGVGIALARRMRRHRGRTFVYLTDGELQEGSTWESAMLAGYKQLDRLVAVIDVNRVQADGPLVLEVEPVAEKLRAFGWWAEDVDGNDIPAILSGFEAAAKITDRPKALVCHTEMGFGVPLILNRERNHFVRVSPHEWDGIKAELEAS
jgi:transketolase